MNEVLAATKDGEHGLTEYVVKGRDEQRDGGDEDDDHPRIGDQLLCAWAK